MMQGSEDRDSKEDRFDVQKIDVESRFGIQITNNPLSLEDTDDSLTGIPKNAFS